MLMSNNLYIFINAAETGSLTETAKKLYISQPAVSQAIKKLEEELNVKLFTRDKRNGIALTDTGEKIRSLACEIAQLENRIYQTAYNENHLMGGTIRVASVPLATSLILSRILPKFKKQYPLVEVVLLEGNPLEVKNMVENHRADFGISTSPYYGLDNRLLMKDHMVAISRDNHVDIDLENINGELIFCKVAHESLMEQLRSHEVDLSHCLVVEAASTEINLVANGNGIGIISELMLSSIPNSLVISQVSPNIEIEISLIAHHFENLSTAAKEICNMITESISLE